MIPPLADLLLPRRRTLPALALLVFVSGAADARRPAQEEQAEEPSPLEALLQEEEAPEVPPADLVILGRVYTMDPERPRASLIAVRGDRIAHLGEVDEIEQDPPPPWFTPRTKLMRTNHGAILPGFNDAHTHLTMASGLPYDLDLSDVESMDELLERVRRHALRNPRDRAILGQGWDPFLALEGAEPNRAQLDEYVPRRPVLLFSEGMHIVWTNSAGLSKLKLLRPGSKLPGAIVLREPGKERLPSGILIGNDLLRPLRRVAFPPANELRELLLTGIREANRRGLTTIQEPVPVSLLPALTTLFDRGQLTLRLHVQHDGSGRLDARPDLQRTHWITFESGEASAARDAQRALRALPGEPPQNPQTFLQYLERARLAGERTLCHTTPHAPQPLTQGFLFSWPAIQRLAEAGGLVAVTPAYLARDLSRPTLYGEVYGEKLATLVLPLRAMLDQGIELAFGSEYPQNALDPHAGLFGATQRRSLANPRIGPWRTEQAITNEEALRAYTLGSARAEGAAHLKGMLREGLFADIVVLKRDPMAMGDEVFPNPEVTHTIVGGEVVFRHDGVPLPPRRGPR